jgi:hypothetical protein
MLFLMLLSAVVGLAFTCLLGTLVEFLPLDDGKKDKAFDWVFTAWLVLSVMLAVVAGFQASIFFLNTI